MVTTKEEHKTTQQDTNTISAVVNALAAEADHVNSLK